MADTTPTLREAAQQALEALTPLANATTPAEREALTDADAQAADAASCDLRAALAEQAAEQAETVAAPAGYALVKVRDEEHRRQLIADAMFPPAPAAAEKAEPVDWRTSAAAWLRQRADRQRKTNADYPQHVKCYPSWETRVRDLEWLADDLEREQAAPPAPARQEPLTEESVAKALADAGLRADDYKDDGDIMDLIRAVERAHGIRAAQAEGGA